MSPIRTVEFYSGIGGLHRALTRSGVVADVVRAFDWDPLACAVYEANHGPGIVKKTDIGTLTAADLQPLACDLWLLSPACQPCTVLNPGARGAADPRAASFLHLISCVLPDLARAHAHPQWLLVENVAGFETSTTRRLLVDTLYRLGYHTTELLLTPLQFGIPNSRLRYYLIARFAPFPATSSISPLRHIPGRGADWVDPRYGTSEEQAQTPVNALSAYLDDGNVLGEYAVPGRVLEKWGRLFDIVLPSARRTCCFTRGYTQLVERAGSILQENEALNTTTTFDAFLADQRASVPGALAVLASLRLRYLTPSELLRLLAFPADKFVWPAHVSRKVRYRLLGNSVNVHVVAELLRYLFEP
ncbi:S-adenosyl-L-methionine-dependent methyltransferase [Vararia minispora EC-137]|uniref:S-adenosyl-L-methionine-dependent methyltransferase n=1 Tax=Vararia minispora EC-137 TaxID=1314806 RepID=A0ACB8Q916_9AGAM|nr:S-adenosyl-L-methionine-dependent methyltransferase [Vararia minispora EC-137]